MLSQATYNLNYHLLPLVPPTLSLRRDAALWRDAKKEKGEMPEMQIFREVVNAETGEKTYEPVDVKALELPADHPVRTELAAVKRESIERRHKLSELQAQVAAVQREEEGEKPEPEAQRPTPKPAVQSAEDITSAVLLQFEAKQAEKAKADNERKLTIDKVMKETGVPASFRAAIEAAHDENGMRQAASVIVSGLTQFDKTPSDGNGQRDVAEMFSGVYDKLGIPKPKS